MYKHVYIEIYIHTLHVMPVTQHTDYTHSTEFILFCIAILNIGETYTRPTLQELKTGAARLAITLSQHADKTGGPQIPIIPVGLM